MATEQQWLGLRAALAIGLAASLTRQVCLTLGLGDIPAAYGVVVGVLVVRPDFCRWPLLIYPVFMVIAGLSTVIGLCVRLMFPAGPEVWWFGLVGVLMQLRAVALPAKLALLTNVVAAAGVLPLLDLSASWTDWGHQMEAVAIGLAIGTALQWGLTPSGHGAPAPPSGPEVRICPCRSAIGWRSQLEFLAQAGVGGFRVGDRCGAGYPDTQIPLFRCSAVA